MCTSSEKCVVSQSTEYVVRDNVIIKNDNQHLCVDNDNNVGCTSCGNDLTDEGICSEEYELKGDVQCPQFLKRNGETTCLWHHENGYGDPTTCELYDKSRCIQCNDGFFLEKGDDGILECSACMEECKTCVSSDQCKTCENDLILKDGRCITDDNCLFPTLGGCIGCEEGRMLTKDGNGIYQCTEKEIPNCLQSSIVCDAMMDTLQLMEIVKNVMNHVPLVTMPQINVHHAIIPIDISMMEIMGKDMSFVHPFHHLNNAMSMEQMDVLDVKMDSLSMSFHDVRNAKMIVMYVEMNSRVQSAVMDMYEHQTKHVLHGKQLRDAQNTIQQQENVHNANLVINHQRVEINVSSTISLCIVYWVADCYHHDCCHSRHFAYCPILQTVVYHGENNPTTYLNVF